MALKFLTGKGSFGLGRLFGLGQEETTQEPPSETPKWFDGHEVEHLTIENILSEEIKQDRKVHIIALEDFRVGLGDKWARLRGKVTLIAEGIIQRHLGHGNLSNAVGEDKFLLVFRTVPPNEGQRRAILIADELGRRLIGANFVGMETAKVRIAEVSPQALLTPDGKLDLAALAEVSAAAEALTPELTRRAGIDPGVEEETVKTAAGPKWTNLDHETTKENTESHLVPLDRAPATAKPVMPTPPAQELRITDSGPTMVTGPFRSRESAPEWKTMDSGESNKRSQEPRMVPITAAERSKTQTTWTPMAPTPTTPVPRISAATDIKLSRRIDVLYRPTWNGMTQAVDTHFCQPVLYEGKTQQDAAKALAACGGSTERFDQMVVTAAMVGLATMATKGIKGTLVLPLHFASLHRRAIPSLLDALSGCAEAIRLLHLVIEIINIPETTMTIGLIEDLMSLHGKCRDIMLRAPLPGATIPVLKTARPVGLSVDLSTVSASELDETNIVATLAAFYTAANDVPCCLWGVRTRSEALAGLDAGFVMINGTALMPDLTAPRKPVPVSAAAFRKAVSQKPETTP